MNVWIYHLLASLKSEGLNCGQACLFVGKVLGYNNLKNAGITITDLANLYRQA